MDNRQIANNIKNISKVKKIPVSKLLSDCNIRKSLIYDMEKRNKTPSSDTLQKIATYFNVSVDYLITGKENPQTVKNDSEISDNSILICRGGEIKKLHFTPEQLKTIEKMLDAIEVTEDDRL